MFELSMKDQEYWWHDELNKLFTFLTLLLSAESRRQLRLETKTLRFFSWAISLIC